jgi:hypothetical protein
MLVKLASLKVLLATICVMAGVALIDPEAINFHLFPQPGPALLLSLVH